MSSPVSDPGVSENVAFKIVDSAEWAAVAPDGAYAGAPVDLTDGYIHMSTREQLAETARKHFAGRSDLLLLTVALDRLGESLVWEPSRGGALFPHIYGPLPKTAVTGERAFSVAEDGAMVFDPAIPEAGA